MKRRQFIKLGAAAGVGSLVTHPETRQSLVENFDSETNTPVVISSANGFEAVNKTFDIIQSGKDALDGVIAGVNLLEDDPNDHSVGLGGLPNEDGIVELDACCFKRSVYFLCLRCPGNAEGRRYLFNKILMLHKHELSELPETIYGFS